MTTEREKKREVKGRNEKKIKDLSLQSEEDKRLQTHLNDLVDKMQSKLKLYKKQIEETEEIASLNLAKYRKVQQDLTDAVERADQAENQVAKNRAKNRSTMSVGRATTPQVFN